MEQTKSTLNLFNGEINRVNKLYFSSRILHFPIFPSYRRNYEIELVLKNSPAIARSFEFNKLGLRMKKVYQPCSSLQFLRHLLEISNFWSLTELTLIRLENWSTLQQTYGRLQANCKPRIYVILCLQIDELMPISSIADGT